MGRRKEYVVSTTKVCPWCEELIHRKPHIGNYEWSKVRFHGASCSTRWRTHGKPKSQMLNFSEKTCVNCGEVFHRKDTDSQTNWDRRRFCNKRCASSGNSGHRVIAVPAVTSEEQRLGLVRYIPGTPEFEQIARLYL